MSFSDYHFRSGSSSSHTTPPPAYVDFTLEQMIVRIANADVEMQEPPSEGTRFLIIDTNVLLDHLEVLKKFVGDVEGRGLPVFIVVPGIVIQELDGQKRGDDRRAKSARQASQWLLGEVQKRRVVKGQANEETCKPSGIWKRTRGEVIQSNDEFISDCCQYYYRQQLRTYLCTGDVNLRIGVEIAERDGRIKTIAPPSNQRWSSWALLSSIFEDEPDILNERGVVIGPSKGNIVSEDDSMDVDDSLSPSHPLDRLHKQVVTEFSKLLDELVLRVGGPEIHGTDTSIYAPEWRKIPFPKWTATECLSYLNHKRKVKASYPEAGVFLRLPHSGSQSQAGRSGHYWPREAWDSVIGYLTRVGATWEDAGMEAALGNLERRVEEVFAMKLRPTGT